MDEAKQKYYEYDPREGGRWWIKNAPPEEPWFEKELIDLAGLYDGRKPRLRVVWGGTQMSDITEVPQLKYHVTRSVMTKRRYTTLDGSVKTWSVGEKRPEDIDPLFPLIPVKEPIAFGRLRWAIEQYVSPEELGQLGRFRNLRSESGEKLLRDFPSEGVYDHYFWVQTAAHKYRDLDREVLTAVQAMYLYNINTSEAQKTLDDIERLKNQTLVGAAEARSIFNSM